MGAFSGYEVGAIQVAAQPGKPAQTLQVLIPRTLQQAVGVPPAPAGLVVPPRAERQVLPPLPLSPVSWANGDTDTSLDMTGSYQSGENGLTRRIALKRHNVGVASPGLDVDVTRIMIGNTFMMSGTQSMPVESFDPLNPAMVEFPSVVITSGMDVVLTCEISAIPAKGETVRITGYIEIMSR